MRISIKIVLLLLILSSCQNEVEVITCSKNLSDYNDFSYELFDKKEIETIKDKVFYSANLLIKINREKGLIKSNDLYQYSLAVAYNEGLAKTRIFYKKESYDIANKYELEIFNINKIINEIAETKDKELLQRGFLGCFVMETIDKNWFEEYHSDNIHIRGFKQIADSEGKLVKKLFKLE